MIYRDARVSTETASVAPPVEVRKQGAGKVFREIACGAQTARVLFGRSLDQIDPGHVLLA